MRWTEFKERCKADNVKNTPTYTNPQFVKELIEDYHNGTMELYELYNSLNTLHVFGSNLREYFNSVTLNSYEKDLLRSLHELHNSSPLESKYFNYSDKGYLYRNRPFILLPIIKQELADMIVVSDDEEACLKFFKNHKYDMEKAKKSGFSNGDWKEDIQTFITGWKETVRYLTYLTETCKSIITYFEDDLLENPYSIRQFFYDYAFTFDFFVLVVVYETYIKYHYLDDSVANDISEHYKRLKPVMHEALTYNTEYDTNDFDEKLNNPKTEEEAEEAKKEEERKAFQKTMEKRSEELRKEHVEEAAKEDTNDNIYETEATARDVESVEAEVVLEEEIVVEQEDDDTIIDVEVCESHHEEVVEEEEKSEPISSEATMAEEDDDLFDSFFDEVISEAENKAVSIKDGPVTSIPPKEEEEVEDVFHGRHHWD